MVKSWGRYAKGAALGKLGFCTSWAVDVHGAGSEWVEVVEVELCLANLGEGFRGKRIVHVSDLHCSRTVSGKYLGRCIERINVLDADIVVLTGDYVTYDTCGRFGKKVLELLERIESRMGLYACLGNHDYGVGGLFRKKRRSPLYQMIEGLESAGVEVLRNESRVLEVDGKGLWLVGLGDLWAEDFEPAKAFEGVEKDGAVIALAHNPDSIEHMGGFWCDAVMSGHTHGAGVEWTRWGAKPFINKRSYTAGLYEVGGKKLYVNRGLGRLGKFLFNARPEITVYNLC